MQIDVAGQLLGMEARESGASGRTDQQDGSEARLERRLGEGARCSASAGRMVAETGCGRSCLLLPCREVRPAEFHYGNHKSSGCMFSCAQEGKTGFLKGTMGKSKATLK